MILVLNCGSQSIKWKVFNLELKPVKEGKRVVSNQGEFNQVLQEELTKIGDLKISLIGHRVVHGGEIFRKTLKIVKENINDLEKISHFAPLHNPFNILGIKKCQEKFPNVLQFAVFDTEFFSDLPEKAFTYALPENIIRDFKFRRYGFQGTSHEYVAKKAAASLAESRREKLKKPFNKLKIITCHLGGGASVTAIKNGKAIDTSMGFTPLEGIVMMTRSGNVDPGIVLELAKQFTPEKAGEILNKESGLKGICGDDDMLKILKRISNGDVKAKLAMDVFVYSIQKYIGAYYVILNGCDILVFTGSIGSGLAKTRNLICKNLDILKSSQILAIETDEELAIAQKVLKINQI